MPKSVIKDVILADANLKNYYSEKVNLEKVVNHTYNINAISKQWEAYAVKILNDFTNIKGKVICFTNDKIILNINHKNHKNHINKINVFYYNNNMYYISILKYKKLFSHIIF